MIRQVVALAGLLAWSAGASASRAPLQPVKPWVLDYAEAKCLAWREYGSAAKPVVLAITPSPNLETYELSILSDRTGPFYAEELQGSIDFGRGPIQAWLLHYGEKKQDIERFRISAADMDRARSASSVRFITRTNSEDSFSLELMPQLLDGLKDCVENLRQYWNFGGEKDGKIAVPSKGDVRSVFSASDFPREAMERHQEGTAQFLLLIDEQGKIASCDVLKTSGVPDFDAMGCAVISERAKFKPALDPRGKPTRSSYVTPPVVWRVEP